MQRIITLAAVILTSVSAWAQSPDKMSYQAVIRDANNDLVTLTPVGMQISILQGNANGTEVYIETQSPTSNANGLVSIEIGSGTTTDDFSAVEWGNGPYFIKTETDPLGGTNYTITGTSQLLSVPFAFHANTADSIIGGINVQLDSAEIASLGFITEENTTNELQDLTVSEIGDTLTLNGGNSVIVPGISAANFPPVQIGELRDGGIVFWVDPTGQSGLVMDLFSLGTERWGCYNVEMTGADSTSIGAGPQNTVDILAGCTETEVAAKLCSESLNGGFNDWFLPSIDALVEINTNITTINQALAANGGTPIDLVTGFPNSYYWSSTEATAAFASTFRFNTGNVQDSSKGIRVEVRAVRAF